MDNMVDITINGALYKVNSGISILEAAKSANITIPTLCFHEDLCVAGNCRVCLVEVENSTLLQTACSTPVVPGMGILTNSKKVRRARKDIINLLLSEHSNDCLKCFKNGHCEFQNLAAEYALDENPFISVLDDYRIDISSPSIRKDDSKCVRCQRCVRTCKELQHVHALAVVNKGKDLRISTFMDHPLHYVVCTNCGQCVNRCPTGALTEQTAVQDVWNALEDTGRHVVVQTAPAVRVALGEYLGYNPGERVTGKLVTALKNLGFDAVFDTNFTADLTIIEEGTELLNRLKSALVDKKKTALPQFTSCSPGWIKYIEHEFPDLLDHVSTCKSPQQMFGSLAKSYYAKKRGIDPAAITVVSIMPCTAKKFEAQRPEMSAGGFRDVDFVLTTRELAHMIQQFGINFRQLPTTSYDSLLGTGSGAAVIFGATGGVMEAAIRSAYEIVTGREVPFAHLDVTPVRGMDGVKEASLVLDNCKEEWSFLEGVSLKVAVAHGLANARKVVKKIAAGETDYHFVEIMTCPGGCLGGGGQPIPTTLDIRQHRMNAIYAEDADLPLRKSHENPEVNQLYAEFLGSPGSKVAHKLLHTRYVRRER